MLTAEAYNALLRGEVLEDDTGDLWKLDKGELYRRTKSNEVWFINNQLPHTSYLKIKVKMMVINGLEVPEPMRVEPKKHASYFVPDIDYSEMFYEESWDGHPEDIVRFKHGLVHSNPANAILHAKALLSFSMVGE